METVAHEIAAEPIVAISIGLFIILALVLVLPFKVKRVEENLEAFFLTMGLISVTISGLWSGGLVIEALKAPVVIGGMPIGIFQVVLIAGLVIYYFNKPFYRAVNTLPKKLGPKLFLFLLVAVLGLVSSIVSVIVTAVILAEVIAALPFQRGDKIKTTVVACFAVGLGAALTPVGEPLSTILVSKLSGPPYNADFIWPAQIFGAYVIPGVIVIALFGALWVGGKVSAQVTERHEGYSGTIRTVLMRAMKVYIFVAALILLGEGLSPLIIWYLSHIQPYLLYWVNIISAVLDNATLTAVEIGPELTLVQIKYAIMALLISGGMLIPGNIPNIVAAGRLKISMKEWAIIGMPMGMVILAGYFVALILMLG